MREVSAIPSAAPAGLYFRHRIMETVVGADQRVLIENIAYNDTWIDRNNELIASVNAILSLRSCNIIKEAFPILRYWGTTTTLLNSSLALSTSSH